MGRTGGKAGERPQSWSRGMEPQTHKQTLTKVGKVKQVPGKARWGGKGLEKADNSG